MGSISPPPKLSCHTASPFFTPLLCSIFARMYLQGDKELLDASRNT